GGGGPHLARHSSADAVGLGHTLAAALRAGRHRKLTPRANRVFARHGIAWSGSQPRRIAVLDTIGTLAPLAIDIVTLFPAMVPRVMGRKAPRKRLARNVMACPMGVPPNTRTFLGAPPTLIRGERSKSRKPRTPTRRENEMGCLKSE